VILQNTYYYSNTYVKSIILNLFKKYGYIKKQAPYTYLRYYLADDSRYDNTEFWALETTCSELFVTILTGRTLRSAEYFSGRETLTVARNSVSKLFA
jgi:hypothetical protein